MQKRKKETKVARKIMQRDRQRNGRRKESRKSERDGESNTVKGKYDAFKDVMYSSPLRASNESPTETL